MHIRESAEEASALSRELWLLPSDVPAQHLILAAAEREAGKVTLFPRPTEAHETDALAAAAEAAVNAIAEPVELDRLTPEQHAAADEMWERLEGGREPERTGPQLHVVGKEELPVSLPGEPVFADDREYALWLIDDLGRTGAHDRAWLAERLTSPTFRLWLDLDQARASDLITQLRTAPSVAREV